MVRNGQNYRKGGKNFQIFENFSINNKKYKSFETFTHLSSDFELQIGQEIQPAEFTTVSSKYLLMLSSCILI